MTTTEWLTAKRAADATVLRVAKEFYAAQRDADAASEVYYRNLSVQEGATQRALVAQETERYALESRNALMDAIGALVAIHAPC